MKIHLVLIYVNSWYSHVQVLRELMLDGMTNIMTLAWRKQMIVPLATTAAMDRIRRLWSRKTTEGKQIIFQVLILDFDILFLKYKFKREKKNLNIR